MTIFCALRSNQSQWHSVKLERKKKVNLLDAALNWQVNWFGSVVFFNLSVCVVVSICVMMMGCIW